MVPSPGFAPGRLRRLVTLALVVAGGLPLAAGADTAFGLIAGT